jgi:hypothetical protein
VPPAGAFLGAAYGGSAQQPPQHLGQATAGVAGGGGLQGAAPPWVQQPQQRYALPQPPPQ